MALANQTPGKVLWEPPPLASKSEALVTTESEVCVVWQWGRGGSLVGLSPLLMESDALCR